MTGKRVTFSGTGLAALLVAPQLILVFTFFYWPTGEALYWAFTLEPPFGGENQWVGLQNFETVFTDPLYWNSVRVSIVFAIMSTALAMGMALTLALFVDRQLPGYRTYRFLYFWPYAVAAPAVGLAFRFIFAPDAGFVSALNQLYPGLWNPARDGAHAVLLITLANAWSMVAYNFIFFLAALQSIPRSLVEAGAMIEKTPVLNALTHVILFSGLLVLLLPLWIVFVASTHDFRTVNTVPMPLWPGDQLIANYTTAWTQSGFGPKLLNSFIVAIGVTAGKIALAALSAFSIVYFRYRLRMVVFWLIFITLMLPLEVRIVPTYAVAANVLRPYETIFDLVGLNALVEFISGVRVSFPHASLLNSYTGLILPLIATATGTFLYRQFFLTVPEELAEAAKMDGSGPLRFFWDVLLPLSKTNMAALGTIMFVYAWNQYLWPLLVITDHANYGTAVMQLQRIVPGPLFGEPPRWHIAMAGTLMVMLPPLLVVVFMQRWFVRGLVNTDK